MISLAITGARVALSACMLLGAAHVWQVLGAGFTGNPAESAAGSSLAALSTFAAMWLLLGVRSRVVALMASLVHAGVVQWSSLHGHDVGLMTTIVPLLAIPVLLCGGGAFAMQRGGWRGIL